MKNQDLAKLPHRGCLANKNKTFCENDNSLALKSPPTPSEKPRDRQLKNQRGDPWKKNIIFFKKSSKYNETWLKSSEILH